ncbi:MAG: UDP-N-acetylmuramate--L-alanine ligase [Bryobacteraceae bacterium]|nr:MAG: UDP-N-acetylmuramate--L-alanine ligase [Bryobacteraceae bacterium]
MFFRPQPLHFTGIGGIGMSGLALLCRALGCAVSGSDVRSTPLTGRLASLGMRIALGHAAENVPSEARALIVTSAAAPDNPEVLEARRRGIPVATRGELLAELMRGARGIAVAGSHGKTTTCSMLACAALDAGLDPTVCVGTLAPFLDGWNARLGGPLFIAESDESDGSFLELAPECAVITNIDREHLDYWKSFEAAREAFLRFANRVSIGGIVALCIDDAHARSLLPHLRRAAVAYGRSEEARLRVVREELSGAGSRFRLALDGRPLGEFELHVPGAHNVLNAAACAAILLHLGLAPDAVRAGLAAYRGAGRRMELKGEAAGVAVIDDYGHHPAEIRATLAALRLRAPRRLAVLFQPHRYTRTQLLFDEFVHAFGDADIVWITDIYAASEPPLEGVTAEALARAIAAAGHRGVRYAGALDDAVRAAAAELREGDLLVTLGAGDVTRAGPAVLALLRKEERHGSQETEGRERI